MAKLFITIVITFLLSWTIYPHSDQLLDRIQLELSLDKATIRVTFNNVGQRVLLLSVGNVIGTQSFPHVRLAVGGNCDKRGALTDGTTGGALSGRGDPWVILMPPASTYSLHFSTSAMILPGGERLADILKRGCTVSAHFDGSAAFDQAPGGEKIPFSITRGGPTRIPFWIGRIDAAATYQ